MAKPLTPVRASTKSKTRRVPKTKVSKTKARVSKTKTRVSKSKTRAKTRVSKTKTRAEPMTYYHSEESSFTSNPAEGEPYGKVVTVDMKNGKGEKSVKILNKNGKTVNTAKSKIMSPRVIRVRMPAPLFGPGLFGAFGF